MTEQQQENLEETQTLSKRQQNILSLIIREYSEHGAPLGSKTLVEKHNLEVSSATVRNEMAALEQEGYLIQPHTSAGRIPTEKGYRYFVKELMADVKLSSTEQLMIQHQFHQARLELDQWMRLSAAVLAHSSRNASLVTSPKVNRCQLKHLELISIQDQVALLILVLKESTVKQQILNLAVAHTQDELRSISMQLTDLWANCGVNSIKASATTLTGFAKEIANVITDIMSRINTRQTSDMYHDGLLHVLNDPESTDTQTLQQVIRFLEEQRIIDQLVGDAHNQGGVQIIIGGEGRWNNLSQVSIVLSRYGIDNGVSGTLGVIGPIRMVYGRAVSIVQYMSHLMSNLMVDLYGPQLD